MPSARPWRMSVDRRLKRPTLRRIDDRLGNAVAYVKAGDEAESNARLIVRAVNNHRKLCAVIRALLADRSDTTERFARQALTACRKTTKEGE